MRCGGLLLGGALWALGCQGPISDFPSASDDGEGMSPGGFFDGGAAHPGDAQVPPGDAEPDAGDAQACPPADAEADADAASDGQVDDGGDGATAPFPCPD